MKQGVATLLNDLQSVLYLIFNRYNLPMGTGANLVKKIDRIDPSALEDSDGRFDDLKNQLIRLQPLVNGPEELAKTGSAIDNVTKSKLKAELNTLSHVLDACKVMIPPRQLYAGIMDLESMYQSTGAISIKKATLLGMTITVISSCPDANGNLPDKTWKDMQKLYNALDKYSVDVACGPRRLSKKTRQAINNAVDDFLKAHPPQANTK